MKIDVVGRFTKLRQDDILLPVAKDSLPAHADTKPSSMQSLLSLIV